MKIARWSRWAVALAGLLFASPLPGQFTYRPRKYQDIEATLTVEVASQTAERGLGAATFTLTVEGPASLEVEEPHLGDAAAAWKEERSPSTTVVHDKRATWRQVIHLHQSKMGIEALPDVSLRFRDGPDAKWEEAKWVDVLKHLRDVPSPLPPTEEQPSWLRRWGFVLALAAIALLVLLAWRIKRWLGRREAPLPPDRWALGEIERLEKTLTSPQGQGETYHTQMSFVVRRYLTERFGLHVLQQTTAEFLDAVCQVPQVSPDQRALLSELFQRCDLAKFAHLSTPPEECRHTAELARELVRQTSN